MQIQFYLKAAEGDSVAEESLTTDQLIGFPPAVIGNLILKLLNKVYSPQAHPSEGTIERPAMKCTGFLTQRKIRRRKRRSTRRSNKRSKEIIALLKSGLGVAEVSKRLKMHPSTVYMYIKRFNLRKNEKGRYQFGILQETEIQ